MPIGLYWGEKASFSNQEVSFKEQDMIYLFTDGYVDQIGGLERKTFKTIRFKKLLKEISHKPVKEQKSILREEHEIWRAGQEQIDDILINFDDARTRATLKVLADLSKKNQVILFTHHSRIVDEAKNIKGDKPVQVLLLN